MAKNRCTPEQHAGKGENADTQGASFATPFSTENGELEAQGKLKGLWNGCRAQETACDREKKKKERKKINLSWGYWRCLMSTAGTWAGV